LFAEDAIDLLRAFYISGNPLAPKPHRNVRPELQEMLLARSANAGQQPQAPQACSASADACEQPDR